jgi:CRP-like cAMP-binding protein
MDILKKVPLFALLDDEELGVLAGQVELKTFAPRQRIYKMGETAFRAYVVVSGSVRVATIDEDNQEVVVDLPGEGEFFGFASMMAETPIRSKPCRCRRHAVKSTARHWRSVAAKARRRAT